MEGRVKGLTRLILLSILWTVLFFLFLLYTFPVEGLERWVEGYLESRTGLKVSIDGMDVGWGLTASIDGIQIGDEMGTAPSLRIERLLIAPSYRDLLKGRGGLVFDGTIEGGGTFTGRYLSGGSIEIRWKAIDPGLLGLPAIVSGGGLVEGRGTLRLVPKKDLKPSERLVIRRDNDQDRDLSIPPLGLSANWAITGMIHIRAERP